METISTTGESMAQRNNDITESVKRERIRLWAFIRKRIADPSEAEDILQDVLFEFVEAYHLPEPIEQVGAWLFRVARNRIIDRFRKLLALSSGVNAPWTAISIVTAYVRAPGIGQIQ
jgi:DNA-directed RNA polymerase specialized sigma24 family protein